MKLKSINRFFVGSIIAAALGLGFSHAALADGQLIYYFCCPENGPCTDHYKSQDACLKACSQKCVSDVQPYDSVRKGSKGQSGASKTSYRLVAPSTRNGSKQSQ